MASIRDLKKDINYVLGDIIEAVYFWEATSNNKDSKEGSKIIDKAIAVFDDLMAKVNDKKVDNRKKHLNGVRSELEKNATALIADVNKLG